MPRLADAEDDARQHEGDDRPGETVRDMPDGPDRNGDRIADLGAEAVDQPPHEQKTQRIGELEGGDDVAIVVLGPFQPVAERRREQPEHRSEEHTSELQSLMRISYAVFCLKNKNKYTVCKYKN